MTKNDHDTSADPRRPDKGFEDGLDELPPNIPPGFLGEMGLNLRDTDHDGPHGLNAGIIQEWTWEMTFMVVLLTYVLFFPLSFVILWRSRRIPHHQKIIFSVGMVLGIVFVVYRLVAG